MKGRKLLGELDEDIREHLQHEIDENIARGMTLEEARRAALQAFGNVTLVKEDARDVWVWRWLEEVVQDTAFAFRFLRKHWSTTAVTIFSLSVAMSLGVVAFGVANTFLLQPLAGADPDQLVMIYGHSADEEIGHISYPDYRYFREHNAVFTDIAARPTTIGINFDARGVRIVQTSVSDNYFAVLGIKPFLGQFFSSGDDTPRSAIAVLTYAGWVRLGSDPQIIGKKVGAQVIIGVAPREFKGSLYGLDGDVLSPLTESDEKAAWLTQREARQLSLIARLRPGVTKEAAQAEISALAAQLAVAYPKEDKGQTAVLTRATMLPPEAIPTAELFIGILVTLVVLVLLIACANVANLQLALAVGRRQEAAIKLAIGASRLRLIRQLLKESAMICGASAALAFLAVKLLLTRYPRLTMDFPGVGNSSVGHNLRVDGTVIALTVLLVIIAVLATGLAPAIYASSAGLSQVMSGENAVGGARRNTRRNALVIVQVAICTLVLIGLGLCERSLYNLRHSDLGFRTRQFVAVGLYPKTGDVPQTPMKKENAAAREAISRLPGVESVTLARDLPLDGMKIPAQVPDSDKTISVGRGVVDDRYFETLGVPILDGRVFNSTDRENTQEVVVINRKLADEFWPGQTAVGKVVVAGDPRRRSVVIGVVAGKHGDLYGPGIPALYYSLTQHDEPGVNVIARTSGDPRLWVEPIRQTVRSLGLFDGLRPVTFDEWMNLNLMSERVVALCVAVLSGLALLLAVLGLFGAVSCSVSERKKEFGIRAALGAHSRDLMGMVLRQTLMTTGIAVVCGMSLGAVATIALRSQFYGISPLEWTVFLPVSLGMISLSLVVAFVSARRWTKVDPMETVRHA